MKLTVELVLWMLFFLAAAESVPKAAGNRARRYTQCRENEEYPDNRNCCLNCPAGTYVSEPCRTDRSMGECTPCQPDTFSEHSNGLNMCLQCTKCNADMVVWKTCTQTEDTQCQCKKETFCLPGHACEVCRKCLKCSEDEVIEKNCTHISDTICSKRNAASRKDIALRGGLIVGVILFLVVVLLLACSWYNSDVPPTAYKPADGIGLGESTNNSSESSLNLEPAAHIYNHFTERNEDLGQLVPVNGHSSLKKLFDYFEECININCHNKFFRKIGLNDNTIDRMTGDNDKMYKLLCEWNQTTGADADINDLLTALVSIDQKLAAQKIHQKALQIGEFTLEEKGSSTS